MVILRPAHVAVRAPICISQQPDINQRKYTLTSRIPKNTLNPVNSIQTTEIFDAWFASLKNMQAVRRVQARIDRAEDGNFGDCEPVGEGVSEMRIHYGPGYRVYFVQRGMEIVILLAGGNKATQSKDIKTALEIARQI